jgi:hypothetical protein
MGAVWASRRVVLHVDDFDAVQTVVETYPKTVEELTVAFCPKPSQFTQSLLSKDRSLFVEPHVWFNPARARIQRTRCPLMHFARLKLQGIVTLGRALPMLEVVLSTLVRRMVEAMAVLREGLADVGDLITAEDLDSLKVCLLDLQEEEEIGILFFTSNLSVPMSILSHLQSTTIDQILEKRLAWRAHLEETDHYRAVAQYELNGDGKALFEHLKDSHILRWSRSTVGYSSRLREDAPSWKHIRGFCHPQVAMNHPPGHQNNLEELLAKALKQVCESSDAAARKPKTGLARLHVAGTTDALLPLTEAYHANARRAESAKQKLIPVSCLISAWQRVAEALENHHQREFSGTGRHLSGWATTLAVPVPILRYRDGADFFHPLVKDTHHATLKTILEKIKAAVFPTARGSDPSKGRRQKYGNIHHQGWQFCLDELRMKTRMAGLPVETRRSLIVLYENFSSILGSPLLFDIVLDFYDVMATLYVILTDLPKRDDPNQHPADYTCRMAADEVEGLNAIIEAIDSALELRQRRLYPENRIRDWALDFRSNILQIILSAEAALKCGVGVVRKFVFLNEEIIPDLGVIHQVAFSSNITVPDNKFGRNPWRTPRRRLAQFRSGVAHLTSLSGFCDFFHESFHLAADEMVKEALSQAIDTQMKNPILAHGPLDSAIEMNPAIMKPLLLERHEEIFVHLCMVFFVYDGDWELALRCHAVDYSTNVESAFNDREEALEAFAIHFAPLMLACMVTKLANQKAAGHQPWQSVDLDMDDWPTIADASGFFTQALKIVRPYLADYDWIMRVNTAGRPRRSTLTFLKRFLLQSYFGVHENLVLLWDQSRALFSTYVTYVCEEIRGGKAGQLKKREIASSADLSLFAQIGAAVDDRIKVGLEGQCRPPTGIECSIPGLRTLPPGYCIDAAVMATRTLLCHIRKTFPDTTAAQEVIQTRFLRRCIKKEGHIKWTHGKRPTDMLIDRTATALFCCPSKRRRERTAMRIAMFKTFWDISSRNRGRRLRTLMNQAKNFAGSQ